MKKKLNVFCDTWICLNCTLEVFQPWVVFQQDKAPHHCFLSVPDFLDDTFPKFGFGRGWIGRGGYIAWPPRSPEITPIELFFWGFLKDKVYPTPVSELNVLTTRISSITDEMLGNIWKTSNSTGHRWVTG